MEKSPATLRSVRRITYVALVVGLINLTFVAVLANDISTLQSDSTRTTSVTTTTSTFTNLTATGLAVIPASSLPDAPIITAEQPVGLRLTNINAPLNQTELSVINDASNNYFEIAGQMFLNKSLANVVGTQVTSGPLEVFNGKPTVIYLGANTCVFCGENRWAMALALGRFGNFTQLFKGYSSLQDGDLPTLYWAPSHYNTTQGVVFGNFYNSTYISFVSMEYQSPITQPVQLPSLSYLQQQAATTGSFAYTYAVDLVGTMNLYQGTPYTVWGKYVTPGADAQDFGNSSVSSSRFPLANMTHDQVLSQLGHPNDQFAWTEYAAADIYIALVCSTIGNAAPVCQLSAIQQLEAGLVPNSSIVP
jgi:hypothetical protein